MVDARMTLAQQPSGGLPRRLLAGLLLLALLLPGVGPALANAAEMPARAGATDAGDADHADHADGEIDSGNEWDFQVSLDDKTIGEHRFRLRQSGNQRRLTSQADFAVKFLGIVAYRYHHRASETWRGDCLEKLSAATDDNGKTTQVQFDADKSPPAAPACTMSFAYWNPALRSQTRLLNAQTGKLETVQIRAAGSGVIEVRGHPVTAARWRIEGAAEPIDVWYAANGDWIGLDATLKGGRRLSYRLVR